jgi:CheY-like chemotaxis protein
LKVIRDAVEISRPLAPPSAPSPLGLRAGGLARGGRAEADGGEGPAAGGDRPAVCLPLRRPRNQQAMKAIGRGTILLVEDDELVLELAQLILEAEGYRILPATNAADALWVLQRDIPVDLLFTDILMPGITGFELAEAALRLRPHLRIAFTSGHYEHKTDARAEPEAVLEKPWLAADLIKFVRRQLQRPQS